VAYTIDPANKRIVLDSTSVTAKSIYVAWVNWVALSDNSKYLPAFRTAGGDDLGGGLFIPPYYFLLNGWRIRPTEANQTLVIDGNLFVDGGGDPIVPTLGVFNVLVKSVVPVQAQGISVSGSSGPTEAQIATAVWSKALEGLSAEEMMRIMLSALAGKRQGLGTSTEQYFSADGTKPRITLTADTEGNGVPVTDGTL